MIIESAVRSDLPRLRRFRADASAWLASQGTDDWADPFPVARVEASMAAGEVFLIREREGDDAAATVTLYANIDPERGELWTPAERMEPALYGHRITVDRQYAGTQIFQICDPKRTLPSPQAIAPDRRFSARQRAAFRASGQAGALAGRDRGWGETF